MRARLHVDTRAERPARVIPTRGIVVGCIGGQAGMIGRAAGGGTMKPKQTFAPAVTLFLFLTLLAALASATLKRRSQLP